MSRSKLNNPKTIISLLILAIIAAVVYGFTATNNVPESGAGEGSGVISGYTVSNIQYSLLPEDPTKIDRFTLSVVPSGGNPPPIEVQVSPDDGVTWRGCDGQSETEFLCIFSADPILISSFTSLQVIAVQ